MPTVAMRRLVSFGYVSFLATSLLITAPGCDATVRTATREDQPLAYVGKVQLGEPKKENDKVIVPLEYDGGQWGRNSAIVAADVKSTVEDREIDITVVTSVATESQSRAGYNLVLPADSRGSYEVYYLDPDGARHEIGELVIND